MKSFNPAPNGLDEVIDPAWLSAMLGTRWPGAEVRKVDVVELLATQATKVRLALEIEGGGADVPTRICIKGVLTDTGAPPSASIVETLFYREAAATLPVQVPESVYASLSTDGNRGVLVMRDVIAAGGRFTTAFDLYTPEQALDGIEQLARLHAATQAGSAAYERRWVYSFLDMITARPIIPTARLQELLDGPRGEPINPALRNAARLQQALERFAVDVRDQPLCLVHGDAHAGNLYRQADGQLGIVDWQVLQKGDWAQDVAYHLAAVLSPEDRRTHERALLDEYRARLKAHGGPDLPADAAWRRYRVAMVYGFYMWAITQKVQTEIIHEFVRRLGIAADDLDSYALLGL